MSSKPAQTCGFLRKIIHRDIKLEAHLSRPSWDDSSCGVSNLLDPACSWLVRLCFLLLHLSVCWYGGHPHDRPPCVGSHSTSLLAGSSRGLWQWAASLPLLDATFSLVPASQSSGRRGQMGGLRVRLCVERHCGALFTCRWSNQSRASDCGKPQATLSTASRKSVSRFL
jgi:hypothetical protein